MPSSAPPAARLIAIGGLSGTGKSTLSRGLAAASPGDCVWLRSDVERKMMFGVPETTRLGAHGYTPAVTVDVYSRLVAKADAALARGTVVIVDAVFARAGERSIIEAVAACRDAQFVGLWLELDVAKRVARVQGRTNDASDATAEIAMRQAAFDISAVLWHRIDAGRDVAMILADAQHLLASQTETLRH